MLSALPRMPNEPADYTERTGVAAIADGRDEVLRRTREQLIVPLANFFRRMKVHHVAAEVTGVRHGRVPAIFAMSARVSWSFGSPTMAVRPP